MANKYRISRPLSKATIDWLCNNNDHDNTPPWNEPIRLANEQEIAQAVNGELFYDVATADVALRDQTADGARAAQHRITADVIYFGKKDWSKKIL